MMSSHTAAVTLTASLPQHTLKGCQARGRQKKLAQRLKVGRRKRRGGKGQRKRESGRERGTEREGQRETDRGRGRDYSLKTVLCWNWRDSSAVRNTCFPCRRPNYSGQYPYGTDQKHM